MKSVNISNELELLKYKILENKADLDDYNRYESILTINGISREEIYNVLKKYNIVDFEELIYIRNHDDDYDIPD